MGCNGFLCQPAVHLAEGRKLFTTEFIYREPPNKPSPLFFFFVIFIIAKVSFLTYIQSNKLVPWVPHFPPTHRSGARGDKGP